MKVRGEARHLVAGERGDCRAELPLCRSNVNVLVFRSMSAKADAVCPVACPSAFASLSRSDGDINLTTKSGLHAVATKFQWLNPNVPEKPKLDWGIPPRGWAE